VRILFLLGVVLLTGCTTKRSSYTILGNIEDPQNQIAVTIADVLNQHMNDSIRVISGVGSLANLDSLEAGKADFGIVDNYSRFSDKVTSVLPLYPQVLHILYRASKEPHSLHELFSNGKIFAGIEGSGTFQFVHELMDDLGVDPGKCTFVDVYNYFEADVIFSFTDLLTLEELRDLKGYRLYSIDDVGNLGRGSLAEGICTRHPQFEPYVIARDLYGAFTEKAILTIKVDAVLVCREELSEKYVYQVIQTLLENNQDLKSINPLLYYFSTDYDPRRLNFAIHPGSDNFLKRHEPSFFERYAELMGVVVTIMVALASTLYTISQWQRQRKKNKIDVYYQRIMALRKETHTSYTASSLQELKTKLEQIQEETIDLVTREKLMADDSFVIFLNLSKIVSEEIQTKLNYSRPTVKPFVH
jgi:TRAP-type uncharacterized transport system substrate-binding protein